MDAHDALRSIQARFASGDPELPNGFAEHAPMGAEALLALGAEPAAVVRWASRHQPVVLDEAGPTAQHRRALQSELSRRAWADVVRSEVAVLAPRLGAHLFHGLIRTAHAVRAMDRGADDAGLAELATALAAWRTWGHPGRGDADGSAAAARVADPRGAILDAARRGAGAFVTAPSIMTLHAVTAPMAFLLLTDVLDDETVAAGVAALQRTHARHAEPGPLRGAEPPTSAQLAALADQWDAHPAKLVEAALRAHALTGDGVFLDAAGTIMS